MSTNDHVMALIQNAAERERINRAIAESGFTASIAFIDLCDSTALKGQLTDDEWPMHLYKFVTIMEELLRSSGGKPVKRLGDGILATFRSTGESESFLKTVREDARLQGRCRFKISVDYGRIHDMFGDGDPYGMPVDRCARIISLATEAIVLASADYVAALAERGTYLRLGDFRLKGLDGAVSIHIAKGDLTRDTDAYLAGVVRQLNVDIGRRDSFRSVGRRFTSADFAIATIRDSSPKPFLLRELLVLPRLPHTLLEFLGLLADDRTQVLDYIGHVVEWSGIVSMIDIHDDRISLSVRPRKEDLQIMSAFLWLPIYAKDALRDIPKDAAISFRGVLIGVSAGTPKVDYAEITQIQPSGREPCHSENS